MNGSWINAETLSKFVRRSDFDQVNQPWSNETERAQILQSAEDQAKSIFEHHCPIQRIELKGKPAFRAATFADTLILRQLGDAIRRVTTSTNQNRPQLIRELKSLFTECTPFSVVRTDIKTFYESFDHEWLKHKLGKDLRLSVTSKALVYKLLNITLGIGGMGLPRGVCISADLANYAMQEFDHSAKSHLSVFYYARFVDDIIVLGTSIDKAFLKETLPALLPSRLKLNDQKSFHINVGKASSQCNATSAASRFTYLGYSFDLFECKTSTAIGDGQRQVAIDLAKAKTKNMQTRLVRAMLSYRRTGDFSLLLDRCRFLTMTFPLTDRDTLRIKLCGLRSNYPMIAQDFRVRNGSVHPSFRQLDKFYRGLILNPNNRSQFPATNVFSLSSNQKRQLLRIGFGRGFEKQPYVTFSYKRLKLIQECWKNV